MPPRTAQAGGLRVDLDRRRAAGAAGRRGPDQRKKRAVAKGRHALDALDRLKVGLLDGTLDPSTLARLKVAAEGLTDESRRSGPRRRAVGDRPARRGGTGQGRRAIGRRARPSRPGTARTWAANCLPWQVTELSSKSGYEHAARKVLSACGRAYISQPHERGRTLRKDIRRHGREWDVGQDQELSALGQGAVHERAPARVFSRQAPGMAGGHPEGSQGDAAAFAGGEPEIIRISPTALPRKPIAPSNCARATVSAS